MNQMLTVVHSQRHALAFYRNSSSVKRFNKKSSASAILTHRQSDEVNFYDCSTTAIELLTDEECRKLKKYSSFGSAFTVISDEPTISFLGAHAVTWNGSLRGPIRP